MYIGMGMSLTKLSNFLSSGSAAVENSLSPKRRGGRGQRSVTRPMIGTYDTSDVAIMVSIVIPFSWVTHCTCTHACKMTDFKVLCFMTYLIYIRKTITNILMLHMH